VLYPLSYRRAGVIFAQVAAARKRTDRQSCAKARPDGARASLKNLAEVVEELRGGIEISTPPPVLGEVESP
jgi:hypothetical protein